MILACSDDINWWVLIGMFCFVAFGIPLLIVLWANFWDTRN